MLGRRGFVTGLCTFLAGFATVQSRKEESEEFINFIGRCKYIVVGREIIRIEDTVYGTVKHFKNGKLHREDGPAFESKDGTRVWYLNGELHRDNEPAVEYPDGTKFWYKDGVLHRTGGPAIEVVGNNSWYLNGIQVLPFNA